MKLLKDLLILLTFILWVAIVIAILDNDSRAVRTPWDKQEHVTSTPG